ncbi:MAG: hypothetical protein HYW00_01735, partial [Candidatus Colwellbacteria bacterium]|nr:hypothetical protein [Candidatus Colwellbacteria bacterium]
CFTFAEKAGLEIDEKGGPGGEKLEPEKFKKFIELAKKGETPGGCKSKEQCESYCQSESNKEECITFGQKMGFIDEKKAELFRKTGGKGPGGCNSEESCKSYCNDPGNQESCFKFAEEHGLISQEEVKQAKEGFVRMRQGLENAPPEVASCLKSTLGENIITDIQAGKLTPGSDIGDRVKGCFEKFGHSGDAREGFNQAPAEIASCVRDKLGDTFDKIKSGEATPTPEMGDAFRVCGEQLRLLQGGPASGEGGQGGGPDIGHFLQSAPPGVAGCLKEKLGGDFERAKEGGTPPGQEVKATLRECFESFRPETPQPREFNPQEGSSTPGLNRETFDKFKQEGGFKMPEGFKPPEGAPQQFREEFQQQFQQQFQGEYQQQYQQQQQQQQQYQQPPSGEQYQTPTSPPPSEPAPVPAPAPTTEPAPAPTTQGNIFQVIKYLFGF